MNITYGYVFFLEIVILEFHNSQIVLAWSFNILEPKSWNFPF